jgi:flagellar motility protein MotE (MotC chaperone)
MSRAQEIRQRIDALVASGTERPEAFRQLATELNLKFDSIRGAYYSAGRSSSVGGERQSKPRRRATSLEDAIADARTALERAIESIDREVEDAETRAKEARAEADALKKSSTERKAEIKKRLEALS